MAKIIPENAVEELMGFDISGGTQAAISVSQEAVESNQLRYGLGRIKARKGAYDRMRSSACLPSGTSSGK